jgi:hypothetical protein
MCRESSKVADSVLAREQPAAEALGKLLVSRLAAVGAAFEQVAAVSSHQAMASVPYLVRRLASEVLPRLEAEREVLIPALKRLRVPDGPIAELCSARPEVGLLTEELSRIDRVASVADPPAASLKRLISRLADLLRQHAALELDLAREFLEPNLAHAEADRMLRSLSVAEARARNAMVFVAPPVYLPTEAHSLRHNPRHPRVMRLNDLEEAECREP